MNSFKIRELFFNYFAKHNHTIVSSSPLIPAQDPTLLFANAGMNQFKDVFLGKEERSYNAAVSIQKCVRAGGKHNDLDQVGYTARHLTFFEMMGNFSFNAYFKKEALFYTWDFLTNQLGLDGNKLWVSVYLEDQESYDIWHNVIQVPANRIIKLGEKDNFWSMGDTGPCGPCSEVYIDTGSDNGCGKQTCLPGCDCDRYLELWNNVFMQYDRQPDGTLNLLKNRGVDTGMGLERITMVLQNVKNIFQSDIFKTTIDYIQSSTGVMYHDSKGDIRAAFHVLADHSRTIALLLADGCSPANDGRGYVLRKIIRRAALFAAKLTEKQNLLPDLAMIVVETMSSVYTNLKTNKTLIKRIITSEVERFALNLVAGKNILARYIQDAETESRLFLTGSEVFKLYDTYGFPVELTDVVAREHGMKIDQQAFLEEIEIAKSRSGKKTTNELNSFDDIGDRYTEFVGYDYLEHESTIIYTRQDADGLWIATQQSPFFAACGGQVDDKGFVIINNKQIAICELKKIGQVFNPLILIKLDTKTVDGYELPVIEDGQHVISIVDVEYRADIMKNHTATHMLQAALIAVLGQQIKQSGSIVRSDDLRFDFTHFQALTADEITRVEDIINQKIQENIDLKIDHKSLACAKQDGVISFFGEKYNPEDVRVVQIPGFSQELCGGTHVPATGVIGMFKIISETALSTGVRRIVAVTGRKALEYFQQSFAAIKLLSEQFKVKQEEVLPAIERQSELLKQAQSKIKSLIKENIQASLSLWRSLITPLGTTQFLSIVLEDIKHDLMKLIIQDLLQYQAGIYLVISKQEDPNKYNFIIQVDTSLVGKINLSELKEVLAKDLGIKGGGSSTMLQGGATGVSIQSFQELVKAWIKSK